MSWFLRACDGDRNRLLGIWCGTSCRSSSAIVDLLVVVGRERLCVADADGDNRIPNESDEEEACSEFWSSF